MKKGHRCRARPRDCQAPEKTACERCPFRGITLTTPLLIGFWRFPDKTPKVDAEYSVVATRVTPGASAVKKDRNTSGRLQGTTTGPIGGCRFHPRGHAVTGSPGRQGRGRARHKHHAEVEHPGPMPGKCRRLSAGGPTEEILIPNKRWLAWPASPVARPATQTGCCRAGLSAGWPPTPPPHHDYRQALHSTVADIESGMAVTSSNQLGGATRIAHQ